MNDIQVFQDVQFGQVRAIIIKNEPWFIGKDVCATLGYARPDNAVTDRVDEEDRIYVDSKTRPEIKDKIDYRELGQRGGWLINESGLYAVIFGSQLESAKAFKKWVTSKVLPSIRKTGGYGVPQTIPEQIQLLAQGNVELNQRVDEVNTKVNGIKEELETFKLELPLFPEDADEVRRELNKKVVSYLGGKDSSAYHDRSIQRKAFIDAYRELKRNFDVSSYKSIKRNQKARALQVIEAYKPPVVLLDQIEQANAQQRLEFKGNANKT